MPPRSGAKLIEHSGSPRPISNVGIVIPAHDEARAIEACLDSIARAASHASLGRVRTTVLVVLDDCTDDTAASAATPRQLRVDTLEVAYRNVGRARRAGFAHLIATLGVESSVLWLATTDADTSVPPDWLLRQLHWRARGVDAIAGTIRVDDWSQQPRSVQHRFDLHQRHLGTHHGHQHVHAANMSFSAEAYLAVGGMPALAHAEDHALWKRLRDYGHVTFAAGDLAVTTSARARGRAPHGFSSFLRALSAQV